MDAGHVVARLGRPRGGDRGVHTAGHGGEDAQSTAVAGTCGRTGEVSHNPASISRYVRND
ncbi:hypothetical protein GCM10009579_08290 [Streptomyces javensis]|uniref:Transposase n=1 Tax=Streptomyces javensis TaxID=114698 RepID=A0ABN1WJU8_9ACTN